MIGLNPLTLGILFIATGLGIFGLTRLLLRISPKIHPILPDSLFSDVVLSIDLPENEDAVLLVQPGGHVLFANDKLHKWLDIPKEDMPNLEHLARRARPSDSFLALCAKPGQVRFSMQGLMVDGMSYRIPHQNGHAILVSLRRPDLTVLTRENENQPGQALEFLTDLGRAMTSSLNLESTLLAILESVERLIPSDHSEINVWDQKEERLTSYSFAGLPGVDRHLEKNFQSHITEEGYSNLIFHNKKPLLVEDVATFREARPANNGRKFPFRSFLGIPLLVANESIGTLELGSISIKAFDRNDLEVLNILSSQAAVALKNAIIHREVENRVAELSGLAKLAQAVSSIQDPRNLFDHLVQSASPLLDVDILGFLIFDPSQNTLRGQVPFLGIPDHIIAMYQSKILPDSMGEKVINSHETILARNATEDEKLHELGLAHLAQATGIQHSILTPLTSGGRFLGYIQAANKRDQSLFSEEEIRILAILAGQAAPIIENARLLNKTNQRAVQSEALRKIAALASSAATLDEILKYSLTEVARLIGANTAAIFLLDENKFELRVHEISLFGLSTKSFRKSSRIVVDNTQFFETVTGGQRIFSFGNEDSSTEIPSFYLPVIETLHAKSGIAVPLVVRDRGIGEIFLGSRTEKFFNQADIEMTDTAAGQIAGAIERSSLYTQTDESLRRKVEQLTSLSRITRELYASLDLERLLKLVYNEAVYNTGADCGTILLLDLSNKSDSRPNIGVYTGDKPEDVLSPIEELVVQTRDALIIEDFSKSDFSSPHRGVGTSLVVPIAHQDNTVGLIHLHARTPKRFDEEVLEIAQTLAIQAAIALGNAQRYHEQIQRNLFLNQGMATLTKLLETSQTLRENQSIEQSLNTIAEGIQEATPFEIVSISTFDDKKDALVQISGAGPLPRKKHSLQQPTIPWRKIRELLRPEFRHKHSYFIPSDKNPITPPEIHPATLLPQGDTSPNGKNWQPEDLLIIPLFKKDQTPLGLISVNDPRNGLRPDHSTIETLEIFANQVALTIERHQKIDGLRNTVDLLQIEVDRAHQASETAKNQLPFLLRKDLEQTISVQRLNSRAQRIQAALEIVESVNRQADRMGVFQSLGQELIARMGLDIVLIAEPSNRGPVLTQVFGQIPAGVNPESLIGQRNPLRRSFRNGSPIFAANLANHNFIEWQNSPLISALRAESFLCLPIVSAKKASIIEAAILGVSHEPVSEFIQEDQQIFALIARQIAIALHNLNLLDETRHRLREVDLLLEFSRQLGSLNPEEIMRTLVESALEAITNAQASMIALWDSKRERLVPRFASGYRNNQRIMEIIYKVGEAIPGTVFQSGDPHRFDDIDFAKDYNLSSQNLIRYQEATDGYLPISSLAIPIQAGDMTLGVMVLDNFNSPNAFTLDDEALISSLTQQTGLILENARLFQAAERRSLQLQSLTDVSTTITSNLQVDAIITSLLEQLQIVIPFDTGTLWLRNGDKLTIRAARGFEDNEERFGLTVAIQDSQLLKQMITSGRAINVTNVHEDPRFPAQIEHPYLSWLGIPLLAKGEVMGVIALEKKEASYYTAEHVQAAAMFAGQAAVALENARLFEDSVQRTEDLDQRTKRLDLFNRMSSEFSSSLDPGHILKFTAEQLHLAVECSMVSGLLLDEGNSAYLIAESPQFAQELPMPIDATFLLEHLRKTRGAFITNNARQEQILKPMSDFLAARKTRALLVFPLSVGDEIHGLLLLHEDQETMPTDEIDLVSTISNQAAVALGNARLFETQEKLFRQVQEAFLETEEQARRLTLLNDMSAQLSRAGNLNEILDIAAETTGEVLNADRVSAVMVDKNSDSFTLIAQKGIEGDTPESTQLPLDSSSAIKKAVEENQIVVVQGSDDTGISGIHSFLVAPLYSRDDVIGTINAGSKRPYALTQSDQNILLQIGSLVSATIENKSLLEETQRLTEELEQRVKKRTEELEIEHNRTQTLLGIITELSASLDMDIVLNRTLSLINKIVGAEHSTILLTQSPDAFLLRRASFGYTIPPPSGGEISAISVNDGLAGWVISNRQSALIPDIRIDDRWIQTTQAIKQTSEHRSAIAVPLLMGEEALGALLLFHREAGQFSEDKMEVVQATAKQIAVAINNAQLYSLIRDQAERLGNMLRTQQIEASRLRAILESVADGVLVTNSDGAISLFNASAEIILGLSSAQVIGKSLDDFTGLFGRSGRSWTEKIRLWSADPTSYKTGDTFLERITLEDSRVVAVSLAPVGSQSEFLGTVSIFRDITHQVEVDRMKSEFVATVSHELRTPMTSIRGYVDVLLMGAAGDLNEQQNNFLRVVQINTERLNVLVDDLLEVSHIESGKIEILAQIVDIAKVTFDVVKNLEEKSREQNKPMRFNVIVPEEKPLVLGDPERIRQILENLVDNAYIYTPENGLISIKIHPLDKLVQVDIKDNGIGIAPEDQPMVFERFYRGEDPLVLSTAGTGLGLSIVQHLIELHGGDIWLESSGVPGDGSTFSFTLPAYFPDQ